MAKAKKPSKPTTAKTASKKASIKKPAKSPAKSAAKAAKPAKAPKKLSAAATAKAKTKTSVSGLKKEISKKAKPLTEAEKRRSRAAAAVEAAMAETEAEEEEADDEEFDPEAFLAASGGKGIIRSHVMRKERVDMSLPVRYRVGGPLVNNALLMNLSKSGLGLEHQGPILKKGTALRIEIPLPHTSELFAIQAEVIWSDYAPGTSGKNRPVHTGLNFLQMSMAKKAVISNFIQSRRDEIVMAKIGLDKFTESVPVAGLD